MVTEIPAMRLQSDCAVVDSHLHLEAGASESEREPAGASEKVDDCWLRLHGAASRAASLPAQFDLRTIRTLG